MLLEALGLTLLAGWLQACSAAAPLSLTLPATLASTSSGPAVTSVPAPAGTPLPPTTLTRLPPALPPVIAPQLVRIEFQDEQDGWGIANNAGGMLVRSVDAGSTWLNASPPGIAEIGSSAVLTVLNPDTAWVLVPGVDFFSGTLYKSIDGGVTWDSSPVPFGGAFMQFLDEKTGRALAERGASAGSEAVEMFQTSDGGASWVSVFHNDPNLPGASDSLPLAGIKNGMRFFDANIGWVSGSSPAAGEADLYLTRDGGASWAKQSLPLPAGSSGTQFLPQAPVLFGLQAYLPVLAYLPGRVELAFYGSQSGGLTWMGAAGPAIPPGLSAFADAQHVWCWDGGPTLYFSTDGTHTWQSANPGLDLSGRLSQLQFVPASAGSFSGWALTRPDEAGHSQLYHTLDGINWAPLIH